MWQESEHPRDSEGKFTKKEYRQNTPYEELTKRKKRGIIQLPPSEYAVVAQQVFERQVRARREGREIVRYTLISTANYSYLVSMSGDSFIVLKGYDIEKDWDELQQERRRMQK